MRQFGNLPSLPSDFPSANSEVGQTASAFTATSIFDSLRQYIISRINQMKTAVFLQFSQATQKPENLLSLPPKRASKEQSI
jgi:hypothetical protein